MDIADLKAKIRDIKDFPTEGILFKDITTLLKDGPAFRYVIDSFAQRYSTQRVDVVVGIESRGFILGGALAHQLNAGFVPVRKLGKLPGKTIEVEYELEYGRDALAVHEDASGGSAAGALDARYAEVSVRTTTGETISHRVVHPRGTAERPLSSDDVDQKFLDCAGMVAGPPQTEKLLGRLRDLGATESVRGLFAEIGGAAR